MAGNEKGASTFSRRLGEFIAEERARKMENGRPWSQQRLADEMNARLDGDRRITKAAVRRIERGEQEIRASEVDALRRVFDLPVEDLMDPDAARSRKLVNFHQGLRAARDAAWKGCSAVYDEGRKSGRGAFRKPGYRRVFGEVFGELPPSTEVPPAAAATIRDALQEVAWLGVDHYVRDSELGDRAGELARRRDEMERLRAEYIELLWDEEEHERRTTDIEAEVESVRLDRAAHNQYKRS